MTDIEQEINELRAELRKLKDKEEIRDVIYNYNRAIDRMDRELLLSCYHEDATTDHSPFYKGNIEGFADFVMFGLYAYYDKTYYSTGNILIALNGDKADCESYIFAPKVLKEQAEPGVWLGCGRFLDKFERRDGEWRIAHRILVTEWEAFAPSSGMPETTQNPSLPAHEPKRGGREDISYKY